MRLAVVFNQTRPDTWGIYFLRAFRQLGHEVTACAFDEAASLGGAHDLYIRIDDGDYYERGLPMQCRPAVYWISDTHLPGPMKKLTRGARQYDVVLCAMRRGTEQLRAAGIEAEWAWGGACDPDLHRRVDVERTYDLGFVGTDGGSPRKFYLQALRERYPNSRIGVAAHEQMGQIYSRSRVGFNYCPTQDTLTMRCFEIMACGALLLLNEVPGHTHRQMGLIPGTHFVLYRSPTELFALVDHFLSHEAERRQIAEAGYRETVSHHTYLHRVQWMAQLVATRLGGRYHELGVLREPVPRVLAKA